VVLKNLNVRNFRCFEDLAIQQLGRINLISGKNSVGKTSLLEAIFLLMGGTNLSLVMNLSALRGIGDPFRGDLKALRELLWQPLFRRFGPQAAFEIFGSYQDGARTSLSIQVSSEEASQLPLELPSTGVSRTAETPRAYSLKATYRRGSSQASTNLSLTPKGAVIEPLPEEPLVRSSVPAVFLAAGHREHPQEDAERLGRLEIHKRRIDLVKILHPIEPRLARLATVGVGGVPIIHGDVGLDKLLPLALMGDGLRRLTSILLTIATTEGGFVLIDEIENGLHHSVLAHAWQVLAEAAEAADVQVFATTHSFECIRSAHEVFGTSSSFRLHRLERIHDDIHARTYDPEALASAMKAELEVR
jgi:hypothetical protein